MTFFRFSQSSPTVLKKLQLLLIEISRYFIILRIHVVFDIIQVVDILYLYLFSPLFQRSVHIFYDTVDTHILC